MNILCRVRKSRDNGLCRTKQVVALTKRTLRRVSKSMSCSLMTSWTWVLSFSRNGSTLVTRGASISAKHRGTNAHSDILQPHADRQTDSRTSDDPSCHNPCIHRPTQYFNIETATNGGALFLGHSKGLRKWRT
jgi:hypothetical protein